MRLPKNRALRGLILGLNDLQNPWTLALALLPGERTITLRLDGSPRTEIFVVHPGERREFVRTLARTVLGKDTSFVVAPAGAHGGPVGKDDGGVPVAPAWVPLVDHFIAGQYGWEDCPATIRFRVLKLVDELATNLGETLVGTYLHGSLAMGCFNPRWSDIDILAVTKHPLGPDERRSVAEALLRHSNPPRGIEAMVVAEPYLRAWEFPTPYCFYFSEKKRSAYEADLRSGAWSGWAEESRASYDLAANLPRLQERGIRLSGKAVAELIPSIPIEHYITSILRDFESKKARIPTATVSGVLNACRDYSFLKKHRFDSKQEAAEWALRVLPKEERKLVRRVLEMYRGYRSLGERFDEAELTRFFAHMEQRLSELRTRAG